MIELYHQHGTSEQFHSEIKSDMDLERLPSGKFATNALVLSLGQVAYNILRLCGQTSLQQNGHLPTAKRMPTSQAGGSPSVAERDPGLDVPGRPLDPPFASPGAVVLAEQSLARDLGATLSAVYPSGVPGHTITNGKENHATVRREEREVQGMLCPDGGPRAAGCSSRAIYDGDVTPPSRRGPARFA